MNLAEFLPVLEEIERSPPRPEMRGMIDGMLRDLKGWHLDGEVPEPHYRVIAARLWYVREAVCDALLAL